MTIIERKKRLNQEALLSLGENPDQKALPELDEMSTSDIESEEADV